MDKYGFITVNGLWVVKNKPVKVDKFNGSQVKNCLDDALKRIFEHTLKYRLSNRYMDIRLVLCTIACLFSGFSCAYDYIYPFPKSRLVLATCSIVYLILASIVTAYMYFIERYVTLLAIEEDKITFEKTVEWAIYSFINRYTDQLTVEMTRREGDNMNKLSFSKSVGQYFDVKGHICYDLWEKDILNMRNDLDGKKTQ